MGSVYTARIRAKDARERITCLVQTYPPCIGRWAGKGFLGCSM